MPPPIGTLVHELGHNWLGKADIAVQTVLLAMSFVAVGLRLWARRLQEISWQGNDGLIVAAAVRALVGPYAGMSANSILLNILTSSQIFMAGRYSVGLVLILLCGMGLHAAEVARIGGPEVFVQFDQVSVKSIWVSNFYS
jgi:hypothetical protein